MSRKYQHIQFMLPQIKEMLQQGKTHKEIEQKLGLTGDRPIHNLLKRERKESRNNEEESQRRHYRNTSMKTSD